MGNDFSKGSVLLGACLLTLAPASLAYAQSAPDAASADSDAGPAAHGGGAGEIVVTANKREQNLSDVGATITALGADDLVKLRVASGQDLASVTPGLAYAPTTNNTPVYTLRGVGFYEATLAAYPSTSLYIDQAPLPLPVMASKTVFDLERVEVLKGPQGTLFGNNATAGAINFIAAKPTREFSAGGSIGYGRFNTLEFNGFVSGPVTDDLRVRFATRIEKGDGWQKSFSRDDRMGEKNNVAGRFLVDWDASDRLKFSLNVNGWRDRDEPQAPQLDRLSIQNPAGSAGISVVPPTWPVINLVPPPKGSIRGADWSDGEYRPFTRNSFWQVALRTDFAVTDDITLTALTSYDRLKFLNQADSDATPLVVNQFANHKGDAKSFNQELRIANGGQDRIRWVIGANYERTKTGEIWDLYSQDSTNAALNSFGLVVDDNYQKMKNYAGFANIEFDVSDQFTVKGGIRQSQSNRWSNMAGYSAPGMPKPPGMTLTTNEFFNIIYPLLFPGTPPLAEGDSILIDTRVNPDGSPVDPATYLKTGRYFGKLKESSTSWSVGVDFKPSDDVLLYANVAKGYKSGSFPILSAALYTAVEPVKQESLLDYEVGMKLQMFDRKLSVNMAGFYYDYTNKQLLTIFVDPIFGGLQKLQNVPKSRVKGAELSVVAMPFAGLKISGDLTYLDAKVKRYDGAIGSFVGTDGLRYPTLASFKGVDLPFSPELSYSIRFDYDFSLGDSLGGFVGAGVNGQTSSYSTLAVTAQDRADYKIDNYALVNATAGLRASDDRWRVWLWGKNIFNKYYMINRVENYDVHVNYIGRPAEYGVTVSFKI
ncbi:TonB-dependent receptor [Tsuneonella sp. CC-YZS046]|uniref:TonB-dependent receptor n=1 Tax=Tsuneonella sp. CC-YZS046 TaxID=3042152 RepID=UPI002D76BCBA|nr:TonB-dependent receptor [Tsuneonella sp. CC-YZS046]WRO66760.1 TonB-dependent receptor [Tsuneonella sp. CC-YZS046]